MSARHFVKLNDIVHKLLMADLVGEFKDHKATYFHGIHVIDEKLCLRNTDQTINIPLDVECEIVSLNSIKIKNSDLGDLRFWYLQPMDINR